MSDPITPADATDPSAEPAEPQAGDEPKVFDAEYVKKIRADTAKYRTEAKANAAAAEELAQIKEAQKTEAQKAADRLAEAEAKATAAEAAAVRWKVAAKYGVSDEDADLFLTGTDEETLTKQAQRLTGLAEERKKNGNTVPREGTNPPAGSDNDAAFARQLLSGT